MSITNNEGLTFEEWNNAANCYRHHSLDVELARREWSNGVDPGEYAQSSAHEPSIKEKNNG
jgi:hypothetical protein